MSLSLRGVSVPSSANGATGLSGQLRVHIYDERPEMGRGAAAALLQHLERLLSSQDTVRLAFAAAPSQDEFLEAICARVDLDWHRVEAFHVDEYLGLDPGTPELFGSFLRERLFDRLPFGAVHYLNPNPADPESECARYGALLGDGAIDVVCLGIGENGHLAFNDPPVANFADPQLVKVVELDDRCRQQQVNDGCFPTFDAVPTHAMTVTIPALMTSKSISVVVPGGSKAEAVRAALMDPISTACPATILRRHRDAVLYLDREAARYIEDGWLKEDGQAS